MATSTHIMVVDDDARIGQLFKDVLQGGQYEVDAVLSGEDAVVAYQKHPYTIVFLDMILPGMNGLGTLKALKAIDANVRVVIMTGYSVLGMLEDAAKSGIITTLIKPFHIDQIKKVIDESSASGLRENEAAYTALIIDEKLGLEKTFKKLLDALDFKVYTSTSVEQIPAVLKDLDLDLILFSADVIKKDTMKSFYYMKEVMPTSKCVLLVDEYMDLNEISRNIRDMFRK